MRSACRNLKLQESLVTAPSSGRMPDDTSHKTFCPCFTYLLACLLSTCPFVTEIHAVMEQPVALCHAASLPAECSSEQGTSPALSCQLTRLFKAHRWSQINWQLTFLKKHTHHRYKIIMHILLNYALDLRHTFTQSLLNICPTRKSWRRLLLCRFCEKHIRKKW